MEAPRQVGDDDGEDDVEDDGDVFGEDDGEDAGWQLHSRLGCKTRDLKRGQT